jgi:hypothetical protein
VLDELPVLCLANQARLLSRDYATEMPWRRCVLYACVVSGVVVEQSDLEVAGGVSEAVVGSMGAMPLMHPCLVDGIAAGSCFVELHELDSIAANDQLAIIRAC